MEMCSHLWTRSPMVMRLPSCCTGGLRSISLICSAGPVVQNEVQSLLALIRAKTCTSLPDPLLTLMEPEPVETCRSTGPFTFRVRSNDPSSPACEPATARLGDAAIASVSAARQTTAFKLMDKP